MYLVSLNKFAKFITFYGVGLLGISFFLFDKADKKDLWLQPILVWGSVGIILCGIALWVVNREKNNDDSGID